ncbi:MAG: hypothetical protein ACYSTF_00230 [Planctomycetota bacterium]|jgi:hypothetical protein
MQDFEFKPVHIEDHVEKIGLDVRPIIECKLEKTKLFDFANKLVEQRPDIFESLVQSPNEFNMRKRFIFPGKGELDLVTLAISGRGPVFIFPRRIAVFDEDTDLGRTDEIVLTCIKLFRGYFPQKHIIRLGQINEYIFSVGSTHSMQLLSDRFTKINVPTNGELKLRINIPTDDYNRVIEMQPVQKVERAPDVPGEAQVQAYGVKVCVDFNNRDMTGNLQNNTMQSIIYDSTEFNKKALYDFLNRTVRGDSV